MDRHSIDRAPLTDSAEILRKAIDVLKIEADGIINLIDKIDHNFIEMVDLIYHSRGRVIISGIGKSGIIGRKIVATLNSTGTRSLFLHPVEAMHGDLGQVSRDDIFIALSKSGETDELNILLASIRRIGCKIIAFTGEKHSNLAIHSDIVIDVGVSCEACPLGLAPTASTITFPSATIKADNVTGSDGTSDQITVSLGRTLYEFMSPDGGTTVLMHQLGKQYA